MQRNSTAVQRAHDFRLGSMEWCEGSSAIVKKSELSIDVSLDVDAGVEDESSSGVDLCLQKRLCRPADRWAVQKRVASLLVRRKFVLSSTVLFESLNERLSCVEILNFLIAEHCSAGP